MLPVTFFAPNFVGSTGPEAYNLKGMKVVWQQTSQSQMYQHHVLEFCSDNAIDGSATNTENIELGFEWVHSTECLADATYLEGSH